MEKSQNKDRYIPYTISIVAIIIAIIALAISLPRLLWTDKFGNVDFGFDYLGVIVALLALMVTLMVGWNIWQTIISREEVRKIDAVRKRLDKLEVNIEAQRDMFKKHNLEIICLIDAHAKLYEAEQGGDLSDKYINYAEAIRLLLQSNVDLSYEQFDRAQYGLISVINQFVLNTNPLEVEDFISREKEYNRYYALFISLLNKRGSEIEEFKRRLTQLHDHRKATIKQVKESDMGQRIEQNRKQFIELEKQLREKDARRKADGKNSPSK